MLFRSLGCRQSKEKREMIRVVKNNQNQVFLDATGKAAGRGAYICPNAECFKAARKSKALERALTHSISDEVYARLEEALRQS